MVSGSPSILNVTRSFTELVFCGSLIDPDFGLATDFAGMKFDEVCVINSPISSRVNANLYAFFMFPLLFKQAIQSEVFRKYVLSPKFVSYICFHHTLITIGLPVSTIRSVDGSEIGPGRLKLRGCY